MKLLQGKLSQKKSNQFPIAEISETEYYEELTKSLKLTSEQDEMEEFSQRQTLCQGVNSRYLPKIHQINFSTNNNHRIYQLIAREMQ